MYLSLSQQAVDLDILYKVTRQELIEKVHFWIVYESII